MKIQSQIEILEKDKLELENSISFFKELDKLFPSIDLSVYGELDYDDEFLSELEYDYIFTCDLIADKSLHDKINNAYIWSTYDAYEYTFQITGTLFDITYSITQEDTTLLIDEWDTLLPYKTYLKKAKLPDSKIKILDVKLIELLQENANYKVKRIPKYLKKLMMLA